MVWTSLKRTQGDHSLQYQSRYEIDFHSDCSFLLSVTALERVEVRSIPKRSRCPLESCKETRGFQDIKKVTQ